MKLIKAYIRHRKTEDVYRKLRDEGIYSMTFVECEGTGRYSDQEKEHISNKYPFAAAYRGIKLEILVDDNQVDKAISVIKAGGRTGYKGDGMVIVSPVDEVYKVRTDEIGIKTI